MEFFEKDEFNSLEIENQVAYFNSVMLCSETVKQCCNKIGISYSTLRNRFKKNGYYFNKYTKKYEKKMQINGSLVNNIEENVKKINFSNFSNVNEDNDVVIRSFRIYNSVLNDFILFCENCDLKQYDILSLFIVDGLSKYGKKQ